MARYSPKADIASNATNALTSSDRAGPADAGAFSRALHRALDGMGYVGGARRTSQIAADLELSRSQAYRLLCGLSFPTTDKLAVLRRLGISVDRILDEMVGRPLAPKATRVLEVAGDRAPCFFTQSTNDRCAVAAVPEADGSFRLAAMAPGEKPDKDGIGIDSVTFVTRPSLAVVDDDELTLLVLVRQLQLDFHVAGFRSATELKRYAHGVAGFDAFLIDWRLPDADGDSLIQEVRAETDAPIFILTGDNSASEAIANALDSSNTHHVAKPADLVILSKRIRASVSEKHAQLARLR